jgi:L-aspartate oxidase
MGIVDTAYRELSTDVLVIGSGGAALRAALAADASGAEVLIAVKRAFAKSGATFYSVAEVGAFNVPDGAADAEDSSEQFLNDILTVGRGMSDPRLSRILSEEAIDAMLFLEDCGVEFKKQEDKYMVYQACFSTKPRSHVIQNHFKPISKALGQEVERRNIKVLEYFTVTNLIVRNGQCFGAYALDNSGRCVVIRAKATILATGGASQLFSRNLYPPDITGDGYAMAYRAGAHLVNMEFMQAGIGLSYPFINLFGNYLWEAMPNLTNKQGELLVQNYIDADLTVEMVMKKKALHFPFSSQDISRFIEISVQKEINQGNGTEHGGVYLDFSNTDFETLLADKQTSFSKMWPLTYDWYQKRNVNLYKDKVEIACFGHAINGGVRIGENAESNIQGLFAAGEVAGGPHGADRLGGNMVVTCQVFGKRAGEAAAKFSKTIAENQPIKDLFQEEQRFLQRFRGGGEHLLEDIKQRLQKHATASLLIIRNEQGLQKFLHEADKIEDLLLNESGIHTLKDIIAALELENLIDVGRMMATAALLRTESRGSHYREDFPEMDQGQSKNIMLDRMHKDGYFTARLEDRSNLQ